MKVGEYQKMSAAELQKELEEVQREYFNLRMQIQTGQLTRPHLLRAAKKNIARIKTFLRQKEYTGEKHG